jgi:hypothetical protein
MIDDMEKLLIDNGKYVAPSIKIIDGTFDKCQELISLIEKFPNWRQSQVGLGDTDLKIRKSKEMDVPFGISYPNIFFNLYQTVFIHAIRYSKENDFSFSHIEPMSILCYQEKEDFYETHIDAYSNHPRSMSALLYLNDVAEGGETYFDKFDLSITPKSGRLVLFPSNYPYSHVAKPVILGKKYVAVAWFGQLLERDVFENYFTNVVF